MLYVGITIKEKVGIPESFKVGWYPQKITASSHLNNSNLDSTKVKHHIVSRKTLLVQFCCLTFNT